MKKLLITSLAFSIAFVAQASNVKWGITSGQSLAGFGAGKAYLVIGSLPTAAAVEALSATSFTESSITTLGGEVFRSANLTGGGYYSAAAETIVPADIGASGVTTYTVYLAAISEDSKSLAISTSTKSLRIAAGTSPVTLSWASSGFTTYNVPEPTSGLLFVLGLTGLALRRRRV